MKTEIQLICPETGERCRDSWRRCGQSGYDCWDDGKPGVIPHDGVKPQDLVVVEDPELEVPQ